MSTDESIARLAKLDTCAVSDALDRLGLKGAVWASVRSGPALASSDAP